MQLDPKHEFRLGRWHVKPLRGVIQSETETLRITPKAMDVLVCLARHRGEVVGRDIFLQEVWDGRAFGDAPLNKCIAELRKQLGDRDGSREYIETISKRGYRLVADVELIGEPAVEAPSPETHSKSRIAALVVLIVLAAVGVWHLSQEVVPPEDTTVAVLPFVNLNDEDRQYFADGVHEELINELSVSNDLIVRSRTSTLRYRDSDRSIPDIADDLDVDVIIEGSVRREGDSVRVSAQVIQAESDENLWAGSVERSLSVADLFSIQGEVALEIANALKVTLGDDAAAAKLLPTANLDAYDAFILGKFHYRRKLPGDIRESVLQFEKAIALDPQFVDAWDWLAYAYNHAATAVGYMSPAEAYPQARAAALRALELQPDLATALSILGYIRGVYDRDWVGAVANLEHAVSLNPNDAGTVWSLAHIYSLLNRHDEAIELVSDFAARYPARGRNYAEVANRLMDAGRYEAALRQLDKAAEHDAEPADIADARGFVYVALGRFEDAAASFEFAVGAKQRAAGVVGRLGYVYGKLGQDDQAQAMLDELLARAQHERISRLTLATAYLGVDNEAAAAAEVIAAIDDGGREVLRLDADPFLGTITDRPEVAAVLIPIP